MSSNAKLYDLKGQNNRAVHRALKDALSIVDRDVDGVVIILGRANGTRTETIVAGSLENHNKAAFEGFKLQLNMVAHHKSQF